MPKFSVTDTLTWLHSCLLKNIQVLHPKLKKIRCFSNQILPSDKGIYFVYMNKIQLKFLFSDSFPTVPQYNPVQAVSQTINGDPPPENLCFTIQPSLKYNKVKLPKYLVSEEIIRNTSGGKRGGTVGWSAERRDVSHRFCTLSPEHSFLIKISNHANINN